MTEKTKQEKNDLEKEVKEERKPGFFSTNAPIPKKKKKNRIVTARDLPAHLPSIHGEETKEETKDNGKKKTTEKSGGKKWKD